MNGNILGLAIVGIVYANTGIAAESICPGEVGHNENVIWCDGFEDDELGSGGTIGEKYYEFDSDNGEHARVAYEKKHGNYSLRGKWQAGEVNAGSFTLHFADNPDRPQVSDKTKITDLYWRFYMKYQDGFQGYPDKVTRAYSLANSNWAQAMIAHEESLLSNAKRGTGL